MAPPIPIIAREAILITASNDNSTPNRIRNAFRDDAIKAAKAYSVLPADQKTPTAYREAQAAAQPYIDFLAIAELLRPGEAVANDEAITTPGSGYGLDYRHDVRPSIDETLTAYSDGLRPFLRRSPRGEIEKFAGGIHYHRADNSQTIGGYSSTGRFYGLHFYKGKLEHFGQNGRRRPAKEERGDPRGPDADNDNFDTTRRETTASPGASLALAEFKREQKRADLLKELGHKRAAFLRTVMNADNFAEIAEAAGTAINSHSGRRHAVKILAEAASLMAA